VNQVCFDRVRELLPQTYPMLMVDRVLDWSAGSCIRALRSVTGNDPLINGHFKQGAVVPGALIVEGIAQSALLLMLLTHADATSSDTYVLGSIKARFLHPVTPGDQLIYEVILERAVDAGALFSGHANVLEKRVASCELLVATIRGPVTGRAKMTLNGCG